MPRKSHLVFDWKVPSSCLKDLECLFDDMDRAYDNISAGFGFKCRGCADNCCLSLFYHHTVAEWIYLHAGVAQLSAQAQSEIRLRAADVNEQIRRLDSLSAWPRIMCPANSEGLCKIYPYRPMICRLHGIPNILQLPNGTRIEGPGCNVFIDQCAQNGSPMDRTPFYRRLAMIEKAFRKETGYQNKIKMTVSQMITETIRS